MDEVTKKILDVREKTQGLQKKLTGVGQQFYDATVRYVPTVNTFGISAEIYGTEYHRKSWVSIEKATFARMKHRTIASIEDFEKDLCKSLEEWLDLPKYLMLRIGWDGSYDVKHTIEPILIFAELKGVVKEDAPVSKEIVKKEVSKGEDSALDMGVPNGLGTFGGSPKIEEPN